MSGSALTAKPFARNRNDKDKDKKKWNRVFMFSWRSLEERGVEMGGSELYENSLIRSTEIRDFL